MDFDGAPLAHMLDELQGILYAEPDQVLGCRKPLRRDNRVLDIVT